MNNWLDLVFWIFAGSVVAWILYIWIRMFVEAVWPKRPSSGHARNSGAGGMSTDVGGVTFGGDLSSGSDSGSTFESGGGGDSSGDYSGGGGDFGGGGSSGGWND